MKAAAQARAIPEELARFRGYRIADVARATSIPTSSLYAAVRRGDLKAVRYGPGGEALIVLLEDLEAYLRAGAAREPVKRPRAKRGSTR